VSQNNKLFLETTIQIDRFSAEPKKKEKIDKIISQFSQILSSTYVKMEFRRRFIQDSVYLYNEALLGAETFSDVFLRIEKLHSDYHKRKIQGMIASFSRFFSDTKDEEVSGPLGNVNLEKAVSYFRQAIPAAWENFEYKVDALLNETDCYHAKTGPLLRGEKFDNRMSKCKRTDIKCKIVEFLIQKREIFKKIYGRLCNMEHLDNEQQKIKNILEKALKYPKNMAERQNCWNCGDVIIAVESPKKSTLFTTNIKHFEPICSEIGGKCITP